MPDHPGSRETKDAERWIPRRAVRALIVDPADDAVLLMQTRFPQWPVPRWLTPGGGIDAGETPEAALVREVHEETGLVIAPADIVGGPVWCRRARFEFDGLHYDQRETFFVVRAARFEPDPFANPAVHELDALLAFDWWTAERMRESDEMFVPSTFAEHFERLDPHATGAEPLNVGR